MLNVFELKSKISLFLTIGLSVKITRNPIDLLVYHGLSIGLSIGLPGLPIGLSGLSIGLAGSKPIDLLGYQISSIGLLILICGDISIVVFGSGIILVLIRRVGIGVVITIYFNGVVFVVLDGGLLFNLIVGGF